MSGYRNLVRFSMLFDVYNVCHKDRFTPTLCKGGVPATCVAVSFHTLKPAQQVPKRS